MSKLSSQLWQLTSWLEEQTNLADMAPQVQRWQATLQRWSRPRRRWWLLSGLGGLMLALHWRFLMTAGLGAGAVLLGVLLLQESSQGRGQRRVRRSLRRVRQQAGVRLSSKTGWAIATSVMASLTLYSATRISQPFGDPWLATTLLAQGGLLLAVLWKVQTQRPQPRRDNIPPKHGRQLEARSLDPWLPQLADSDPLKRLIAIRHTTELALADPDEFATLPQRTYLADCFRLMAQTEDHPIVRQALTDHLQALVPLSQLGQGADPIVTPRPLRFRPQTVLEATEREGDRPLLQQNSRNFEQNA